MAVLLPITTISGADRASKSKHLRKSCHGAFLHNTSSLTASSSASVSPSSTSLLMSSFEASASFLGLTHSLRHRSPQISSVAPPLPESKTLTGPFCYSLSTSSYMEGLLQPAQITKYRHKSQVLDLLARFIKHIE